MMAVRVKIHRFLNRLRLWRINFYVAFIRKTFAFKKHISGALNTASKTLKKLKHQAGSLLKAALVFILTAITNIKTGITKKMSASRNFLARQARLLSENTAAGRVKLKSLGHKIFSARPAMPNVEIPKVTIPGLNLPRAKMEHAANNALLGLCLFVMFTALFAFGGQIPGQLDKIQIPRLKLPDMNLALNHLWNKPEKLGAIEPAAGQAFAANDEDAHKRYPIQEKTLQVEGVLVPQKSTVISSSRDGKIKHVYFDDGDVFRAGDVLVEYTCEDLRAEMAALESENALTMKKDTRGEKLFKLEIISDFERLDLQNEFSKAKAQKKVLQARMENCEIRAAYDGRVVNRLANDNEYTRTDRVLMEVASLDQLEVEFLMPSLWLRWINIGAPVTVTLFETGENYAARISRIHGKVDPVSQSIQITAKLEPYDSPLLPGMSGEIKVDATAIREAGIYGYLERAPLPAELR